jgi:hypothetical protein
VKAGPTGPAACSKPIPAKQVGARQKTRRLGSPRPAASPCRDCSEIKPEKANRRGDSQLARRRFRPVQPAVDTTTGRARRARPYRVRKGGAKLPLRCFGQAVASSAGASASEG